MTKIKNILIPYFLTILIVFFVSLPLFHNFLKERAVLAGEKERLQREDAYIEALRQSERDLVPYDEKLDKINSGLPSNPSIPSLIRHLETIIVDSGVELVSIGTFSTTEMVERPHLRETKVEVKVNSDNYQILKNFIKELERSIKIIIIERASISLVTDEERGTRFTLLLSLKTYSY